MLQNIKKNPEIVNSSYKSISKEIIKVLPTSAPSLLGNQNFLTERRRRNLNMAAGRIMHDDLLVLEQIGNVLAAVAEEPRNPITRDPPTERQV